MQGEFFEIKPHPPLLSLSSSDRGRQPKKRSGFQSQEFERPRSAISTCGFIWVGRTAGVFLGAWIIPLFSSKIRRFKSLDGVFLPETSVRPGTAAGISACLEAREISLAAKAVSIPTLAAVPSPGMQPQIPEATSPTAPK